MSPLAQYAFEGVSIGLIGGAVFSFLAFIVGIVGDLKKRRFR